MTIGFTAMQFINASGATLGMSGAKIEINGKAAPPQLLRCLDPPTNVSERDLPVKFCLPYAAPPVAVSQLMLACVCVCVCVCVWSRVGHVLPPPAGTASATVPALFTA